jgi:two-component system chemotaxis response regulator CheB
VKPLRVLVVADPPFGTLVSDHFDAERDFEVVGCVSSGARACALLESLRPDVVTLDLEMAHTDSLRLLEQLLSPRVSPVVAMSSFAPPATQRALRAVALGATDVIEKPVANDTVRIATLPPELSSRVRAAAVAYSLRPPASRPSSRPASQRPRRTLPPPPAAVVAIGASTGGTVALNELLAQLPSDAPAVLVVQHMLTEFTRAFAERLDASSRMQVREAEDGARVERGKVLIAPGGRHMRVVRSADGALLVQLSDDAPVNKHRPSVDVLFKSCARAVGAAALGVVLTGMGDDGAAGLLEMRGTGSRTIAQDAASSAVFGMPKAAISRGAAEHVLPLDRIAQAILRAALPSRDQS